MCDLQYLGCSHSQREIVPTERNVERMEAAYENILIKGEEPSARVAHPELRTDFIDPYGTDMQAKGKVKELKAKLWTSVVGIKPHVRKHLQGQNLKEILRSGVQDKQKGERNPEATHITW